MRHMLIFLCCTLALRVSATGGFANPVAERMAASLGIKSAAPLPASAQVAAATFNGREVRVATDSRGDITSVGYDLFGILSDPDQPDSRILRFVERYLLLLDLKCYDRSPAEQCAVDRVELTPAPAAKGATVVPPHVSTSSAFALSKVQRRSAAVAWKAGNEEFKISFPTDCQLILGMNAPELEAYAAEEIRRATPEAPDLQAILESGRISRTGKLAMVEGEEYLSDAIRNDLFLNLPRKGKGSPELYFNPVNPARTVGNIMLTGSSPEGVPTELVLDRYGYRSDTIRVDYGSIAAFLRSDGCTPYFGVKSIADDTLTGTLFALNADLGYNHVVSVEVPLGLLRGDHTRPVRARMYAYIPLQDVTEQFFINDISPTPAQ